MLYLVLNLDYLGEFMIIEKWNLLSCFVLFIFIFVVFFFFGYWIFKELMVLCKNYVWFFSEVDWVKVIFECD